MSSYSPSIDELRSAVDARLHTFLDDRRAALTEAAPLIDELERLIDAGGKRLRPVFCYWGYRAAGGSHRDEIVHAAMSLELLHSFAVVHDDIMDAADERRGEPTVHAKNGVNFALLAGDLALVLADAAFVGSGFDPTLITAAFEAYSRMRQEVIAGQYLDLERSREPAISEADARRIAVLKSGRYSIEEPLLIGASLARAEPEMIEALSRFGAPLGEAFQLRDDLLGTFGERADTGKPVDSDIREGKRNVLYAKTVALLDGDERQFFTASWGSGRRLSHDEVERLRALVESCGARAATERLLEELVEQARNALTALHADDQSSDALAALIELSIHRRS